MNPECGILADFDLFFFWRRVLMIACTIYAVIRLAQTAWTWYVRLSGRARHLAIARQYLLIQLLRVSPRRFLWHLLDLAMLLIVLLLLIGGHVPLGK